MTTTTRAVTVLALCIFAGGCATNSEGVEEVDRTESAVSPAVERREAAQRLFGEGDYLATPRATYVTESSGCQLALTLDRTHDAERFALRATGCDDAFDLYGSYRAQYLAGPFYQVFTGRSVSLELLVRDSPHSWATLRAFRYDDEAGTLTDASDATVWTKAASPGAWVPESEPAPYAASR